MANKQFTKTTTFTYVLFLGVDVKDPDKEVEQLTLQSKKEMEYQEKWKITLQGVKFNRRVYEPGKIEAELVVRPKDANVEKLSMAKATELFQHRFAELSILDTTTQERQNMAWNYYVYEVNPQLLMQASGDVDMVVKLTMFSLDKLMTLDKYSKAYVAKKLGSGILDSESRQFGFKNVLFKTDSTHMQYAVYQKSVTKKDANGKDTTVTGNVEFIHPYLVQYNESFYDFMARSANRLGEFFYFEEGQLNLGLPKSGDDPIEIVDYVSVTSQGISDSPIDVTVFYRDSMKDGDGEMDKLNFAQLERDATGYPEDIFKEGLFYNAEVGYDEYLYPLEKDKWSTFLREMGIDSLQGGGLSIGLSLLSNYLAGTQTDIASSMIDLAIGLGKQWAALAASTGLLFIDSPLGDSVNTVGNKTYFDPIKKGDTAGEQTDNAHAVQFGTLTPAGWPTVAFYADRRRQEEEQQRQMICIDMGTGFIPVKLGDKIKVSGLDETYVVVEIRQVANEKWTHNYRKYGDTSASDIYVDKQSQLIFAIPITSDGKAVPPVLVAPYIRTSGPQTAFVVDNKDPKYQCRVRIAFPWQSRKEGRRLALKQAQSALEKAVEDEKAAEKYLANLKALRQNLDLQKDTLTKLSRDSDELKEEQDKIEKELKEVRERKAELEKEEKEDTATEVTPPVYLRRIKRQNELKGLVAREEMLVALEEYVKESTTTGLDAVLEKMKNTIEQQSSVVTKAKERLEEVRKEKQQKVDELEAAKDEWTQEIKDIATPWIRVTTPMASPGGGTHFTPQVGDEVLVNFEADNVERPYVVGSLYSKNMMDPVEGLTRNFNSTPPNQELKKDPTMVIMSPNGHQVTFKDTPDGTAFTEKIQGGLFKMISGLSGYKFDALKDLTGGIYIGDRWGLNEISMVSHSREINIKSPFGTVSINAFSGISINAPNGDISIVGKNIKIEAGNNLSITSGTNIQSVDPEATKLGKFGNFLQGVAFGGLAGVADVVSRKFLDMRFLRHAAEVMLRPIEGTMCIKSKRYMMLEAGKGSATFPIDRYKGEAKDEAQAERLFFNNLIDCIEEMNRRYDQFVAIYKQKWDSAYHKLQTYTDEIDILIEEGNLESPVTKAFTVNVAAEWQPPFEVADLENIVINPFLNGELLLSVEEITSKKAEMMNKANDMAKAVWEIRKLVIDQFPHLLDGYQHQEELPMDGILRTSFTDKVAVRTDDWKAKYGDGQPTGEFLASEFDNIRGDDPFIVKAKKYKRMLAAYFIAKVAESPDYQIDPTKIKGDGIKDTLGNLFGAVGNFLADPKAVTAKGKYLNIHYKPGDVKEDRMESEYHWIHFIRKMQKPENGFLRKLYENTVGVALSYMQTEEFKAIHDRNVWKDRGDGLLLISTDAGKTHEFNNGQWQELEGDNRGNWDGLVRALKAIK